MPEFYNNLTTEKSFETLKNLKKDFEFILIGGWAVFLHAKALKSKDIDIVVDYETLEKLKQKFNVIKNERLQKYEIKIQEIDIDIYLPFYSQIGIPLDDIKNNCEIKEGFLIPNIETLLLLKTFVYKERMGSNKGKKDLIDIFALLLEENINWKNYYHLSKKYNVENLSLGLKTIIKEQKAIPELNLNEQKISKLKKTILRNLA